MKITYINRNINKMYKQGIQLQALQNIKRMCREALSPVEGV